MSEAFRETHLPGLAPPESLVVAALRAWMAPRPRAAGPQPDWQRMLALAGVQPAGALGFGLLMSVLRRGAVRPLDVRPCGGPGLGRDESVLLDLVAALQRGDCLSAIGGLSEWLAPGDLRPALRGAEIFARHTAAAGLHLVEEGACVLH
ncbi:hypothetical protein [Falsiroseomonas tokyonensis]|uniref:Uncharacterized protein n=1 Tax=Falsiroseomonas tokyonensis TaxID=430521 RepID=A0ABV7BZ98_9PROT|nr:hypothetical protein [Falsiroseomonas tokyonensis]MBU8539522.1 hypothetical protein [Falsiroseomonas tokyonensis]